MSDSFCTSCEDTGVRWHHGFECEMECSDCPRCGCGMLFAEHELIDADEGDLRLLNPSEILYTEDGVWAGECYEAMWAELDEETPSVPLALIRTGGLAVALSSPMWFFLFWLVVR